MENEKEIFYNVYTETFGYINGLGNLGKQWATDWPSVGPFTEAEKEIGKLQGWIEKELREFHGDKDRRVVVVKSEHWHDELYECHEQVVSREYFTA